VNLTEPSDTTKYRFDGFTVDAQNFVVEKDGEVVALTPRAFDVLLLLLRSNGHVVEKRQLFDEVWKESFVSDNALTKIIKELRHALADSAEDPSYIETIPKRGYQFIGTLDEAPYRLNRRDDATPAGDAVARPFLSTAKIVVVSAIALIAITAAAWYAFNRQDTRDSPSTIAVLPFKPLDRESRDESLELGMAETLITRLSNLRDIVVRPIGSVRKFTDPEQDPIKVGEELQTEAVLDGSIQKAGDRVRVSVRLVDVRTGAALWSEQFDESFTDIFRVQDSIAQRIAGVLALKLSRREQEQLAKHMTDNPAAYELYLRGQFHWHRRGPDWINQSLNAYKLALEQDPNFALAHIGIADAYIMLSGHRRISMHEAEANAAPSITKALQIDDSLAQAHNALAELKYQYQYDWRGAEAEFKTAIELNPNVAWIRQAYGWFLMSDGRFDEANGEIERARQLDPSSLTLAVARGRLYYYSRQYDKAIQHFQNIAALEPDEVSSYMSLMNIYERNRIYPEAFEMFLKIQACNEIPQAEMDEFRRAFAEGGWDGVLRKVLREIDETAARTKRESPFNYAQIYTRLGDKEKAFYWFERVFAERDVSILQFKVDPAYDILRDDPRYAELLHKIGQEP
jgi:TolB-like protein/DNA-binding winged helix-turn-helix (wHTH) protein/Flp pilus assembly protein TadD